MSSRLVRCESRSIKRGQSVGGAFSIGVCELPIPRTIRAIVVLRFAVSPTLAQLAPGGDHFCAPIRAGTESHQIWRGSHRSGDLRGTARLIDGEPRIAPRYA